MTESSGGALITVHATIVYGFSCLEVQFMM